MFRCFKGRQTWWAQQLLLLERARTWRSLPLLVGSQCCWDCEKCKRAHRARIYICDPLRFDQLLQIAQRLAFDDRIASGGVCLKVAIGQRSLPARVCKRTLAQNDSTIALASPACLLFSSL
jgi:hypothetical protein